MKESFIMWVIREEIVDTRKYRYVYLRVWRAKRLPGWSVSIWALDSDNWEVVKEWA